MPRLYRFYPTVQVGFDPLRTPRECLTSRNHQIWGDVCDRAKRHAPDPTRPARPVARPSGSCRGARQRNRRRSPPSPAPQPPHPMLELDFTTSGYVYMALIWACAGIGAAVLAGGKAATPCCGARSALSRPSPCSTWRASTADARTHVRGQSARRLGARRQGANSPRHLPTARTPNNPALPPPFSSTRAGRIPALHQHTTGP